MKIASFRGDKAPSSAPGPGARGENRVHNPLRGAGRLLSLATAVLALSIDPAPAQMYLPPGVGLPPTSVIGNVQSTAGDAVAVTVAQLKSAMGFPSTSQSCSASMWVNSISQNGILTCSQPAIADISGWGSGVAAALGVNTGLSGSVVVNGGALGTPASGTLTNATGLPIGGVTGLGAGVGTALMTAVGSAGSVVVNGGALGTPSSGVGTNITSINASNLSSGTVPAARTNGHQNGTATNDNAAAGEIGEFATATLPNASSTSLTSVTAKTITSVSLTAGDWETWGTVVFSPAGTTVSLQNVAAISTTTNSLPGVDSGQQTGLSFGGGKTGGGGDYIVTPIARISVAATTTVYLVGYSNFNTSTMTASGTISARRVR